MKKLVNKLFGGTKNSKEIQTVRKSEMLLANYQVNMQSVMHIPTSS